MELYTRKMGENLKTLQKTELAQVIYPGEDGIKELEFDSAQSDMRYFFFSKIDNLKERLKSEKGLK